MTTWYKTGSPLNFWYSIASDYKGQRLVAAGVAANSFMYTSTNGGINWTNNQTGLPTPPSSGDWNFKVASDSTGLKLVTVYSNSSLSKNGIYTSTDGGFNWTLQTNGLPDQNIYADWVSIESGHSGQTLFAVSDNQGTYISKDYGSSWTRQVGLAYTDVITGAMNSDGTKFFVVIINITGVNFYENFTGLPDGWGSGSFNFYPSTGSDVPTNGFLACDSTGQYVVFAPQLSTLPIDHIWCSTNFGDTFVQRTIPIPLWITSIACDYTGNKLVVSGRRRGTVTTGGIIISYDGGLTWSLTDANINLYWTSVASNYNGTKLVATAEFAVNGSFPDSIYTTQYACFKEGTKILTDQGYRLIQDLRKGDLVKTLLHGFKPIDLIGKRDIFHSASKERIKDQLYKCTRRQYPEVFADLIITGCHCILVSNFISEEEREKSFEVNGGDVFITDEKYRLPACVDEKTQVYEIEGTHTIYHLALENENYYKNYGIYANGLLVESCSKRYLKELANMELIE